MNQLLAIFLVSFPLLLFIISALGYALMKKAFSPVHKIVTLTKSITAQDLSHRIEHVHSNDEIGELADTLNDMISRLELSFKQIRQFSGDVSHELKTPLTALKGEIEVALGKSRNEEEYKNILKSLLEEAGKLEKIIGDLLFLSKMDARSVQLSFAMISLDDIFIETFEEIQSFAREKKVSLSLKKVEETKIKGEEGLLRRMLTNLILNAIQFTPPGGDVQLSVTKNSDTAIFAISDTGIGIPNEAMPHIFDRFYRVDPSRSHVTGGSGLGLAIVQKIVEIHGGNITVQSTIGHGTTFQVSLPCI
jgi:heavy metal sensor kinase